MSIIIEYFIIIINFIQRIIIIKFLGIVNVGLYLMKELDLFGLCYCLCLLNIEYLGYFYFFLL
jgi:hypothetical protein